MIDADAARARSSATLDKIKFVMDSFERAVLFSVEMGKTDVAIFALDPNKEDNIVYHCVSNELKKLGYTIKINDSQGSIRVFW